MKKLFISQPMRGKSDEDILKELNIPKCMLPEVRPSSCVYGEALPQFFGAAIPIAGAAGRCKTTVVSRKISGTVIYC